MPPKQSKKAGVDSGKAKQRPINAFFFQKPSRHDSKSSNGPQPKVQQLQQQQTDTTEDSPDVVLVEQPAKRARFFAPDATAEAPAAPAQPSQAAIDSSQATNAARPGTVKQVPPPRPGAHQRFQNKLVLGIGNRKAAGKDSIVPQKHTPLELQVVELKEEHAGVLLAIEVSLDTL